MKWDKEQDRQLTRRYYAGQRRMFWHSRIIAGYERNDAGEVDMSKPIYVGQTYRR